MATRIPFPKTRKSNSDHTNTEALARETDASLEEVQKIYEEEFGDLASDAKITQFLGVLASRRTRLRLRKH